MRMTDRGLSHLYNHIFLGATSTKEKNNHLSHFFFAVVIAR